MGRRNRVPGTRTTYYSSPSTETRFANLNSNEGDLGARVEVGAMEHSTKEKGRSRVQAELRWCGLHRPHARYARRTYPQFAWITPLPAIRTASPATESLPIRIRSSPISMPPPLARSAMKKYTPVFDLSEQSVQPAFTMKITNGKIDSASLAMR